MEIVESILTQNPCYKAGKTITVKGLMLHSVGCPQPSAETFVKKWNNAEASRACVHAFIDGNTGKVYQTLPWDHRAWHSGSGNNGSANNTHIGVEMCEPGCIKYTGGATFMCTDTEKAKAVVKRTYETAVELFAYLCKKYQLDPLADGVVISHKEGHDRKIASGHGDPDHLWKGIPCGYTMDGFRKDVKAAMEGAKEGVTAETKAPAETQPKSNPSIAGNIVAGCVVTLAPNAVYYTGKEMPSWVLNEKWIVKSVSGDRAVIDRNVSGTRAINSPVNVRYLVAAGSVPQQKAVTQTTTARPPVTAASQAAPKSVGTGEMSVSDRGVELIAKYEGCRLQAYKCPAGVWTIGYGHTAGVREGQTLPSAEAAKALLKEDLKKYGGYVNASVRKGLIGFSLNQNQFDALTSFCYNCGNGSLQKLVSGRDAATIADKLLAYNKGGGKVLAGLTRRREEERALFLS